MHGEHEMSGDGEEHGTWRVPLPRGRTHRAAALAPAPVTEVVVQPLGPADLAELLDLYGLSARAASKLHADSGGNPYLALALAGAFADRSVNGGLAEHSAVWRPTPLPQPSATLGRCSSLNTSQPASPRTRPLRSAAFRNPG